MAAAVRVLRVQVRQFADHFVRGVDARFRLCRPRLGTAAQPLDFRVHPIFERFLPLALRVQIHFFRFQKRAVVSVDAQIAIFVGACKLDHRGRDIFEKVAVVADHHAGEWRVLQKGFEPFDPGKIQMIGRLVEQQNVRRLHERFDNRQPLAPAAGKRRRGCIHVREPGAAQCFARCGPPGLFPGLRRGRARLRSRSESSRLRGKFRILRHRAQAHALPDGHIPGVRPHAAVQNCEQSRLARTVRADQADSLALGNRE